MSDFSSEQPQFDPPPNSSDEQEWDEAIAALEQCQVDINYQNAQESLFALLNKLDLSKREASGLEEQIHTLRSMLQKLES